MHQVQIDVVRAKVLQGLVQRRFNILGAMLGVPHLAREEQIFTLHTTSPDSFTNFDFVSVDGRAVDMSIAGLISAVTPVVT